MAKQRPICNIPGCGRPHHSHGWCLRHVKRWRRNGDPLGGYASHGEHQRWLQAHADYVSDECLKWPFRSNSRGYAQTVVDGQIMPAARYMCFLAHGEPPTLSLHAAHSCGRGDKGCVNPKHLRWATAKENAADAIAHGTMGKKLGFDSANFVRESTLSITALSEMFNISERSIENARFGRTWLRR